MILEWESPGWRYLVTPQADYDEDRFMPGYDDSAWPVGAAAFGNASPGNDFSESTVGQQGFPYWTTPWAPMVSRLYLRRHLPDLQGGEEVTIRVRVDNWAAIWWNGTYLGQTAELVEETRTAVAEPGTNLLALMGFDFGDINYLDAAVEGVQVVRQYPRDVAGLAAGPRLYPPPKARRRYPQQQ